MCIILYKPKGENLPDTKTIQNCIKNNPDGAGYMFNIPNTGVLIEKGFNTHTTLLDSLTENLKKYQVNEKDTDIIIHARIATQGLTKAENCHPFPLTSNIGELQSTKILCDYGVVHNGIIDIVDTTYPNLSDTQLYIKDILAKIDLTKDYNQKLIELSLGTSKLVIFNKDGLYLLFGNFVTDNGIKYSNTTYEMPKYSYFNYFNSKSNQKTFVKQTNYTNWDTCDLCGEGVDLNDLEEVDDLWLCSKCKKEYLADEFYEYCDCCGEALPKKDLISISNEYNICPECYHQTFPEETTEIEIVEGIEPWL